MPSQLPIAARPLWLNVASSTCVEKGFVNLDNHIFMRVLNWPRILDRLFSVPHRISINRLRQAGAEAKLVRHNCEKPLPFKVGSVDHVVCSHFLEHVFPNEARAILADFFKLLKPSGTMHIIVPDLELITRQYLLAKSNGDISAADKFLEETLLTRPVRGSKRFEILEAIGGMGLAHRWMYDQESIADMIQQAGFQIDDSLTTPSDHVRCNDGISIHVRALKIG